MSQHISKVLGTSPRNWIKHAPPFLNNCVMFLYNGVCDIIELNLFLSHEEQHFPLTRCPLLTACRLWLDSVPVNSCTSHLKLWALQSIPRLNFVQVQPSAVLLGELRSCCLHKSWQLANFGRDMKQHLYLCSTPHRGQFTVQLNNYKSLN